MIGGVAYATVSSSISEIIGLTGAGPGQVLAVVGGLVLRLGFAVAGVYLVIAVADALFERWQHDKDLRMTKDEVKREHKDQETSPEVRAALRRRAREMANRRMMAAVPTADVVITNPTHFAVALRYARSLPAPQVVAKGQDRIASASWRRRAPTAIRSSRTRPSRGASSPPPRWASTCPARASPPSPRSSPTSTGSAGASPRPPSP